MKQKWKRIVTVALTAILALSAGPMDLLREGISAVTLAADDIQPGQQTTLQFGMTWLYNNGSTPKRKA